MALKGPEKQGKKWRKKKTDGDRNGQTTGGSLEVDTALVSWTKKYREREIPNSVDR